jgi:CBS domain-containing membrane protein
MVRTTPVSKIMTTEVRTASLGDKLSDVRHLMVEGRFHHMPIVDGDKLVGILSARDLIRISRSKSRPEAAGADLDAASTIAESMQTELVTIRIDDSIERAIDLLSDGAIHSVLVLDRDERLAGIVTNVDILDYLFD